MGDNYLSSFDLYGLDNDTAKITDDTTVFVTEYNFTADDDVRYEFTLSLKLCFEDAAKLQDALNYFDDGRFNNDSYDVLEKQFLSRSQDNFEGWSYGFGDVLVSDVEVKEGTVSQIDASTTDQPTVLPTGSPKKIILPIVLTGISLLAFVIILIFICCMYRMIQQNRNSYAGISESESEDSEGYLDEQDDMIAY